MRLREGCLLFLVLLTVSIPARASRWYPIDTGWSWVYSSAGGGLQTAIVEAPVPFAGSLVHPLRWEPGSREYVSEDEFGRVFFYGVTSPDGSYVIFTPPVLRMDSELVPGREWEAITTAIYYAADGVEVRRERRSSTFRVIDIGPVEVGAGIFNGAEILHTEEVDPLASAGLSSGASLLFPAPQGTSLERRFRYSFRDTYGEGIGWIRRTDESGISVQFELDSYKRPGVPSAESSWGALKSQYKN